MGAHIAIISNAKQSSICRQIIYIKASIIQQPFHIDGICERNHNPNIYKSEW